MELGSLSWLVCFLYLLYCMIPGVSMTHFLASQSKHVFVNFIATDDPDVAPSRRYENGLTFREEIVEFDRLCYHPWQTGI